jgi:hypothetical protein
MNLLFITPTISRTSIQLVENNHPTKELVVKLKVNDEEHVLRVLADTGASSTIILEACSSKDLIKYNKDDATPSSTMGGQFTTKKAGLVNFLLTEFSFKKYISWEFHVDD